MPRSLSLVSIAIEMRRDPMVANMRLRLCLSTGVVTFSTQHTKTIPSGWAIETRNGCLFMNMMSQCMCCASKFCVVVGSCGGGRGLSLVVRPLSEAVFAPQISVARATSSGKMSHLRNVPALNAEMKF